MSVFSFRAVTRSVSCVLVLGLSIAANDPASANQRGKKSYRAPAPASVGIAAPQAPLPGRAFIINDVLNKRDGANRLAAVNPTGTVSDALPTQPAVPSPSYEPFGLQTFRAPEGALWVKWRQAEAALKADDETVSACRTTPDRCSPAARRLVEVIDAAQTLTGRARLGHVNRSVNGAVRFVSDMALHGVPDLWSAPIATFTAGSGDCEDYAIAKYFVLRQLGIAAEDLQLVLVHDKVVRQDHAVLSVRFEGRWIVLDNRTNLMLDPNDLSSLTPLFTLDHRGVSLFAAQYAPRRAHNAQANNATVPASIR